MEKRLLLGGDACFRKSRSKRQYSPDTGFGSFELREFGGRVVQEVFLDDRLEFWVLDACFSSGEYDD